MKFRGWMLALLVMGPTAALTQSGLVAHAGEQYAPRLADIMNVAQVRHLKLYFAGRAETGSLPFSKRASSGQTWLRQQRSIPTFRSAT
jgi:hypothetical protein